MKTKRIVSLLVAVMCSVMFAMAADKGSKVEVVLLHPGIKCPTCAAIKENTLKVVNETFKKETAAGIIEYKEVVYGPGQNEDVKEKYNVEMTTIVLIKRNADGKEVEFKNLGKFPVNNGRTNPEKYRKELAKFIYFFMK